MVIAREYMSGVSSADKFENFDNNIEFFIHCAEWVFNTTVAVFTANNHPYYYFKFLIHLKFSILHIKISPIST